MSVYVLYDLEFKKSNKKIPYVCLYVREFKKFVRGFLVVDTISFEAVSESKQNVMGVFYV